MYNNVALSFPGRIQDTSLLFKEPRQKRLKIIFWDSHVTAPNGQESSQKDIIVCLPTTSESVAQNSVNL